ncbi:MAG: electron transport complex subunit RsxC [Clostridia bacterium]|nr:electron transport complex subunit RsxC [Clostridia bacterium]
MFPGGVHPREGVNGKAATGILPIQKAEAPSRVIIPMQQHIGAPCKPVVVKGDYVKMGQVIGEAGGFVSAPVHASVSGTVVAVDRCVLPSGLQADAVIIDNDFTDTWVELTPVENPESLTGAELAKVVQNAGIVGLGGATFPTHVKLVPPADQKIDTLVVNGAECEPYLSADHRLMLENAKAVIDGVKLIMQALGVEKAIIGVENNKMDAIKALNDAAVSGISIKALPVMYPQGGEKQLIYALTKRRVPNGALPSKVGVAVCNVGTAAAVSDAVRLGKPLTERVVTVGGLVNKPGNFLARIGTPVENLIDQAGGMQNGVKQLVYGGPMMGAAFARLDIPVTKGCSGILALGQEAKEPDESACIRCGRCISSCPMKLVPTLLDQHMRADRYDLAEKAGVMNCMECGACTFVCPAKRSLTQSFRVCKKVINDQRRREAAKAEAERKAAEAAKAAEEAAKAAAESEANNTEEKEG